MEVVLHLINIVTAISLTVLLFDRWWGNDTVGKVVLSMLMTVFLILINVILASLGDKFNKYLIWLWSFELALIMLGYISSKDKLNE